MDYLIAGLVIFAVGNLIHLERVVSTLQTEIKHIKRYLRIKDET